MQQRLDAQKTSPAAYNAMLSLEMFIRKSSKLEPCLIELVKMRASQINGCAFCLDMHAKDARAEGESEQRLYALPSVAGSPFLYRPRTCCTCVDGSNYAGYTRTRTG